MKNILNGLLATSLLMLNLSVSAEDIDLFVGASPAGDLPNVMIVLDNGANFSASTSSGSTCTIGGATNTLSGTVGGIEQCALYSVISNLSVPVVAGVEKPTLNIGMMVYNAANIRDIANINCGGAGAKGSCLVQPLVPLNTTNQTAFLAWVKSWNTSGGAGNGYIKATSGIGGNGSAMQETWAYFAGKTGLSGRSYADIKPAAGCQKNYIVFVGNSYNASGKPGDASGPQSTLAGTNTTALMNASPAATTSQKAIITSTLSTSCGSYTFPSSAHENKGLYADEWARYMAGQNVTTYTIGVLGASCQAEYAALLTSMAAYGNGIYYPTTSFEELKTAFEGIVSQIQSVNSVFASVSLPVSVNTQGTYLNQVFVGMFRPVANASPRWAGNLKQYKIGYNNGVLKLLDAADASAISAGDSGFISECARSFWTPTLADSYWSLLSTENCIGNAAASNTPDGNIVEKGAQGYKLRAIIPADRTLKTCSPVFASCTDLTDFNTANSAITQTSLDSTSTTNRNDLINWARGLNNKGDETFVAATAMRPSSHGDVVHSRPVAINFGTEAAPNVVVFYGGNDGVLRAVNGNRSASIGTVEAGSELWAFMAPEFYGNIKRLHNNDVTISFVDSTADGALPKPYGIDGPITAYKDASNAWIYATMRRGGRAMYSFGIASAASIPTLKWKKGCPNLGNDTDCTNDATGDFRGIGQTWSSPKILKSSYDSGASPLLIMGGGYDSCEDNDNGTANHNCTASSKGNKIYVMDANTGDLLKTLNTDRGVVGDVTVVNDSTTGLAKYAYAADLGGNVYRVDIGSSAPAGWTITKIASLGCDTVASCAANRKFMFAPDVVEEGGITYVLVGSGDREKPLAAYVASRGVANHFFLIKDKPADATWLSSESTNCSSNEVICKNSLAAITSSATPTQTSLDATKGWYLAMNSAEQVVTSSVTIFGTVTFSTHEPTPPVDGACTSLGTARVYNIKYLNAASANGTDSRFQRIKGDGLPPSPVAGLVTLDNGETVPFVIGANPNSPLEAAPPPPLTPGSPGSQPKSRVYWYIQQ